MFARVHLSFVSCTRPGWSASAAHPYIRNAGQSRCRDHVEFSPESTLSLNRMQPLRIVLTGPEWVGDLLVFFENALRSLGHEVPSVPTNQGAWSAPTDRFRRRLSRLPALGASIAGRGWLYQRERAVKAIERQMQEWRDGSG